MMTRRTSGLGLRLLKRRSYGSRWLDLCGLAWVGLACALGLGDEVDDYVQAEMRERQVPGLALAITQGGQVVKLAGYGLADVEQQVPITPRTVFQIQSVTKPFVALAILMLVEEGKVTLDAPVSAYLEGTPAIWNPITVRHLLNHTSGIKDFINEPTSSLRLEVTDEAVLAGLAARPLNFPPGEKQRYSNSNYHLLAMIIARVTGEAYGAFLQRRVFDPLGMSQSRVMSWSDLIPMRAAGYALRNGQLRNGEFVAESILAYGGGGLVSTAEDLAKWDSALRSATILPRSRLEEMWTPARLNDGTAGTYGLGWGIGGQAPHRRVDHTGAHITGFASHVVRFLDDDLSVILLVNAAFGDPGQMARGIAGLYIPALRPPKLEAIEDTAPDATELSPRAGKSGDHEP